MKFVLLLVVYCVAQSSYAACEPAECGSVDKCYVAGKEQKGPEDKSGLVKFAMCKFKHGENLFIYDTKNPKHIAAIKGNKICAQVCGDEENPVITVIKYPATLRKSF